MKIFTYELGAVQTNAYLLVEDNDAVLIDAPEGVAEVIQGGLKELGATLRVVLLTHGHWDHTVGFGGVLRENLEVFANEGDKDLYENPTLMAPFMPYGMSVVPIEMTKWVEGGEEVTLLGRVCKILHVPGHAPGNIAFYFPEEGKVFVGDALFAGSIGRTDLPGGDFPILKKSIQEQLYSLPDETIVYPGHGPTTTIGFEKKNNPYVKG